MPTRGVAPKTLSKQGAMEIIGHEAIVQTRYRDSVGVWTIGVGHTKAAGNPDPKNYDTIMPLKEVFQLFQKDIKKYADDVNAVLKVRVEQPEFDALVSFHFNTGGIRRASLVKSINAGDNQKAAKEFMNWNKPPAIIGRRKNEQKLFAEHVYSNNGKVTVYPADGQGKVQWKRGKTVDLANEIDKT